MIASYGVVNTLPFALFHLKQRCPYLSDKATTTFLIDLTKEKSLQNNKSLCSFKIKYKNWLFTFTADAFGLTNFRNPEMALIVVP